HTLLQRSGLIRIASLFPSIRLSRLISLGQFLPKQVGTLTELHAAKRPTGRLVQLFAGCVGSQTDQQLIEQSLSLLSHLGYAVEIPANQVCCGALHRHNGYPEQADRLCETNRSQTEKSRAECLITLASACHLELNEHLKSDLPITGMTDFLLDLPQDAMPNLQPLTKKVAIHTPCTSQNDRSQELLRLIPGLEIEELPENSICCGAAGSYLLTQPELSATLGVQKLVSLKASNAEILITGNTGCALQFRQLIEQSELNIDVMHPLELFARQMKNSTGNA
ncbi:MAG: (Fe-S)-binding protein, partial [Candidatus Thiodiazotropha sp. (ex Semelilucina semeliformis)]|nr:(Fe-S)-binding protein [Candidatus Thiodiazotropha sp. (ex Semelilucina semeliformis)]